MSRGSYKHGKIGLADSFRSTAATINPKNRAVDPRIAIDHISEHAFENGLTASQLELIADVVTRKNTLDQKSNTALVRALYPAEPVPDGAVYKAVACLGQGFNRPSPTVQIGMLRWLVMVYHVLARPAILSQLYGVLFNMLDNIGLR